MKVLVFLVAAIAAATFSSACAREQTAEVSEKLERGVTGQGTLYERTHDNDPFVETGRN